MRLFFEMMNQIKFKLSHRFFVFATTTTITAATTITTTTHPRSIHDVTEHNFSPTQKHKISIPFLFIVILSINNTNQPIHFILLS